MFRVVSRHPLAVFRPTYIHISTCTPDRRLVNLHAHMQTCTHTHTHTHHVPVATCPLQPRQGDEPKTCHHQDSEAAHTVSKVCTGISRNLQRKAVSHDSGTCLSSHAFLRWRAVSTLERYCPPCASRAQGRIPRPGRMSARECSGVDVYSPPYTLFVRSRRAPRAVSCARKHNDAHHVDNVQDELLRSVAHHGMERSRL